MKVLLTTLNAKYIHPNLAIRILYQLNKQHENLSWKEFTIKENLDTVVSYCLDFNIVAFSCYIWNIKETLLVCKKIKEINQDIKILLGGPEVSYEFETIIELPYIDFIIAGEGEIAFNSFLKNYPNLKIIPNLIWKKENRYIQNTSAEIFKLEQLTYINPYIDDDKDSLKNKVLYIETSRGCPYKCEFCLASLDNQMRYLPNASIKSQLLYIMQHGRVVKFLDRTFNVKKDFSLMIFDFILNHYHPQNVFQFEITADIIHPDIISFIQQKIPKGLFRFEIGIQSTSQKVNLSVNRKQNFEKTKSIIQQLNTYVEMHLDLIVGLPYEYWQDIKHSFEETFKIFAPEIQLGFLKFLKGTPIKDKYANHEYVFETKAPYQIIKSKYLSEQELENILKLEKALEIYWNKKRAINTLKYVTKQYSIFDFLLQLSIYFETQKSFHQHSLEDIYTILFSFAKQNYPKDTTLLQLITIDFYLHHKIKPKAILLSEIAQKEKYEILNHLKLNHNLYRFGILSIDFDFKKYQENKNIVFNKQKLIFQYDGKGDVMLIYSS